MRQRSICAAAAEFRTSCETENMFSHDFRSANMVHDGAEIKDVLNKSNLPFDLRFDMHSAREWLEPLLEESADVKATSVLVRESDVCEHSQRGQGAGYDGRTRLGRRSKGVRNLRTRRGSESTALVRVECVFGGNAVIMLFIVMSIGTSAQLLGTQNACSCA